MLYCYFSDTSLLPYTKETQSYNTTFDSFSKQGKGVGQITERVLSVFNSEPSPGLLIDPRTINGNTRCTKLFKNSDVANIGDLVRCNGKMSLYYDSFYSISDAAKFDEPANDITHTAFEMDELIDLFNTIETCIYSHTFDAINNKWIYQTKETLTQALISYSTSSHSSYGFVPGSLIIPAMEENSNQIAKVQFVDASLSSNNVSTFVGSNQRSCASDIIFPDYICFGFKFREFDGNVTYFKIYLNPDALLNQYDRCKITHIVFPTDPYQLLDPSYESASQALNIASEYVGNTLTKEVTKTNTNVLDTTNFTGALQFQTQYAFTDGTLENLTFTCIYKGRKPTETEMRTAILDFLRSISDDTSPDLEDLFPNLQVAGSYTIIPFYNTRTNTNFVTNYIITENIFSFGYMNKIATYLTTDLNCTTILNIPGYNMHAISYPTETPDATEMICKPSLHGLDATPDFATYQPISTESPYWITMTDNAQLLNTYLAKIVASEANHQGISGFSYQLISKEIGGKSYSFYSFSVGGYRFEVMTANSYNELIGKLFT